MRRTVASGGGAVMLVGVLSAALVPLRSDLSIATVGLIMVVPVVAAVTAGGLGAGIVGVAAGFLAWDFFFIPPYYTLVVGAWQNWLALGVYAVVMVLVAQVVTRLQEARRRADRREQDARRLYQLSQLLVEDRDLPELLRTIAEAARTSFGLDGVALLLQGELTLEVVAASGGIPDVSSLVRGGSVSSVVRTVPLAVAGRPIGVLALQGSVAADDHNLLHSFANSAALALERARLRDQALRASVLEEADNLRQALLDAVSHDLRTPLSSMKVASSALAGGGRLSEDDRAQLVEVIDCEADRLARLVNGLLDLTRYQAGALSPSAIEVRLPELVEDALLATRAGLGDRQVAVDVSKELPSVIADPLLVGQVLANLIDNAHRFAPPGTPISVTAVGAAAEVSVAVTDCGPGVPEADRETVFERFIQAGRGGRAGVGLWICRSFITATGGRIWVEEPPQGGARFVFTLPVAGAA